MSGIQHIETDRFGNKRYLMNVKNDVFVHFTLLSRAQQIVQSKKLLFNPPYKKFGISAICAVSAKWGKLVPGTQFTHLAKYVSDLDPIVGVVFKTSVPPKIGYTEEVLWERDVPLKAPRIVSFEEAKRLLASTNSEVDSDNGQVFYDKGIFKQATTIDFQGLYPEYKKFYELSYPQYPAYVGSSLSLTIIKNLCMIGRALVVAIRQEKSIPKSKIGAFNKAAVTFGFKRVPDKGNAKWMEKNLASIQLLLESNSWPSKDESEDVVRIGKCSVHNRTSKDPEPVIKALTKAIQAMKKSDVPNVEKALYGDVFIVGRISRNTNLAAQYFFDQDTIELLNVKGADVRFVQSLIHEFGHRIWRKGWVDKEAWKVHDMSIRRSPREIEAPKVGDILTLMKGQPKITEQLWVRGKLAWRLDDGKLIDSGPYLKYLREGAGFPTQYSGTDLEEHFCDAFALYCLGQLEEPHLSSFKAIVVK